ncbi:MAG: hypothetical protein ABGX04_17125 [Myxococcales bacterium]|nr:hypothetical protein [Myxococcales bacterium]HIK84451.1 hypothetical protein [Myxococcales bacterium]
MSDYDPPPSSSKYLRNQFSDRMGGTEPELLAPRHLRCRLQSTLPGLLWIPFAFAFAVSGASVALAQVDEIDKEIKATTKSKKSKKDKSRWLWDLDLGIEGTYESNVFLLSDGSIDRFKEDDPDDAISGRFDDVKEVDDFVVTAAAKMRVAGDGLMKRRVQAWLGVEYDQAVYNEIRSRPRFRIGASQQLGKGRRASIEFEYELDRFKRNYLSGTEPDPGGSIKRDERRYRAGTFSTAEIVASYDQRIWKRSKKRPNLVEVLGIRRIDMEASLGYARRDYDHFSNRDRNELIVGVGAVAQVGKSWRIEVDYGLSSIFTSRDPEFLIIDEIDAGRDLNGNGNDSDNNVPVDERVDRSHIDHTVGIEVEWAASKRVMLKAGYDFMFQDYLSDEPLDLTYNGRKDERHRLFGGVEWSFAKRWAASLGGIWMDESSDRSGENEETSYSGYMISLGLSARFF